jgi:hypothetical protein
LFLTASGWKYAAELRPDSPIQSCLIHSRNISMATYFASGLKKGTSLAAAMRFIERYGEQFLVRSRKAAISIIGTIMRTTTPSPIWNVCPAESTFLSHGIAESQKGASIVFRRRPKRMQQLGTPLKKGALGTAATPDEHKTGKSGNTKIEHALYAGKSSIVSFVRRLIRASIVRTPVGIAHIASVRPLREKSDVWCLTVPDVGVFCLANGAVVHNSHGADSFMTGATGFVPERVQKREDRHRAGRAQPQSAWGA